MPEEVTIREDTQVIQVTSHGVVTAEEFDASLDAILNIRDEQGLTKVFVDATNVKSYPSTVAIFEFGSKLARLAQGTKFAIATSPEVLDDPAFFETVTRNRGAKVRVFGITRCCTCLADKGAERSHIGDAKYRACWVTLGSKVRNE